MVEFVDAQVKSTAPNKGKPCGSERERIEEASKALGKGWAYSSVAAAMLRKAREDPDALPQGRALVRFCELTGVSADWLLFGVGPRHRAVISAGGTSSESVLEEELAAYVTGCVGPSEYMRRFFVKVSGRACLDRLVAIAKAEEDAQAGLLAVSDAADEAFAHVRRLRLEDSIPETPPVLALKMLVAERATLVSLPKPVAEPLLLQRVSDDDLADSPPKPSNDFAKVLQSVVDPPTQLTTSEFLLRGHELDSPRAMALADLARRRRIQRG